MRSLFTFIKQLLVIVCVFQFLVQDIECNKKRQQNESGCQSCYDEEETSCDPCYSGRSSKKEFKMPKIKMPKFKKSKKSKKYDEDDDDECYQSSCRPMYMCPRQYCPQPYPQPFCAPRYYSPQSYRPTYQMYPQVCSPPYPQPCFRTCPQPCPRPCPQPCLRPCPQPCPRPCPQPCSRPCPQPYPRQCAPPCPQPMPCPPPCSRPYPLPCPPPQPCSNPCSPCASNGPPPCFESTLKSSCDPNSSVQKIIVEKGPAIIQNIIFDKEFCEKYFETYGCYPAIDGLPFQLPTQHVTLGNSCDDECTTSVNVLPCPGAREICGSPCNNDCGRNPCSISPPAPISYSKYYPAPCPC